MSGGVFLSFRRDDETSAACALRARLEAIFGLDVVRAEIGGDPDTPRAQRLAEEMRRNAVLIAVFGPNWAERRARLIESGAEDSVVEEIEAALRERVLVLPVLIGDAAPPRAEDLPEALRPLAARLAHSVSTARLDEDAARLARLVTSRRDVIPLAARRTQPRRFGVRRAAAVGLTAATLLAGASLTYLESGAPILRAALNGAARETAPLQFAGLPAEPGIIPAEGFGE